MENSYPILNFCSNCMLVCVKHNILCAKPKQFSILLSHKKGRYLTSDFISTLKFYLDHERVWTNIFRRHALLNFTLQCCSHQFMIKRYIRGK